MKNPQYAHNVAKRLGVFAMRSRSKLARALDWAGLFILAYIVSFIWIFSRIRDITWASGVAMPLSMLLLIAGYMLLKKAPWIKTAQSDAEAKENALFKQIIAPHEDALRVIAEPIFFQHGYTLAKIENGIAYADDFRVIGITQSRACPENILDFYRISRGATFAVYCSLMEPESGVDSLAARLTKPRITLMGPAETMSYLDGEPPTPREKDTRSRAEKAGSTWSIFKKRALRKEQAKRYILYALMLFVAYILTGWPWYPIPGIVCAALGAASARKAVAVKSPFETRE